MKKRSSSEEERPRSEGEARKSATVPLRRHKSIGLDVGFHDMKLHETHVYPDPFPAAPVINQAEHTIELEKMFEKWEPKPLSLPRRNPPVIRLLDIYSTVEVATRETDWASCARYLGAGTFGQVYLGFRFSELSLPLSRRHLCAIKQSYISKADIPLKDVAMRRHQKREQEHAGPISDMVTLNALVMEVKLLRFLKHRNIVFMLESYAVQETRSAYIVLEYCDGVDLFSEQRDKPGRRFTIPQARYFFAQVLEAVVFLHANGIAHMDIKSANILLKIAPNRRDKVVKLADFGLSCIALPQDASGTVIPFMDTKPRGTLPYYPPEMLAIRFADHMQRVYATYTPQPVSWADQEFLHLKPAPDPPNQRREIRILPCYRERVFRPIPCDVYACGVLLYRMLTGSFPYDYRLWPQRGLDHVFRLQPFKFFSFMDMKTYKFICWMLEPMIAYKNVTYFRPHSRQLLTHEWMAGEKVGPGLGSLPTHLDQLQTMYVPRAPADVPELEPETEVPSETEASPSHSPAGGTGSGSSDYVYFDAPSQPPEEESRVRYPGRGHTAPTHRPPSGPSGGQSPARH